MDVNIDLQCIIHLKDVKEAVKPCTVKSYEKIIKCASQWIDLDNIQQVAANKLDRTGELLSHYGYHPSCYVLFTSKRHLEQATKRLFKGKTLQAKDTVSGNHDFEPVLEQQECLPTVIKKTLRSSFSCGPRSRSR